MQNGAIGINLGRNIWQNAHPVPMIRALRSIVHDGANPDEAEDLFNSLKGKE
jgi:putative autoinducer-2 (AI-2) aldolase